jgi:hypothetical protein
MNTFLEVRMRYWHKEIVRKVQEYIDNDKTMFCNLDRDDQRELAGLALKHSVERLDVLVQPKHADVAVYMLERALLHPYSPYDENANDLVEVLMNNAVDHFAESLQHLFEDCQGIPNHDPNL